jgi:hypothetical protein
MESIENRVLIMLAWPLIKPPWLGIAALQLGTVAAALGLFAVNGGYTASRDDQGVLRLHFADGTSVTFLVFVGLLILTYVVMTAISIATITKYIWPFMDHRVTSHLNRLAPPQTTDDQQDEPLSEKPPSP